MRFFAFLAALAGLVSIAAQGGAIAIAVLRPERAELVPHALMVAAGGELTFYLFLVLLLLGFAFSRRRG